MGLMDLNKDIRGRKVPAEEIVAGYVERFEVNRNMLDWLRWKAHEKDSFVPVIVRELIQAEMEREEARKKQARLEQTQREVFRLK